MPDIANNVVERQKPAKSPRDNCRGPSSSLDRSSATLRRTRITSLVNEATKPMRDHDHTPELSEDAVVALIDLGASPGGKEGRHWVLDPIDGTRGFVGGRQYAVTRVVST